jgi:hypothetical protein
LQQVCPPASPSDQAAFDRCRRSLFGDSALRRSLAPRLLWGRRNQDAGAALKDTNLTQFAPDVIAGLYLSLFMYSGEYSTEYVERERLYLIRLRAGIPQPVAARAVSVSVLARRGEVGCLSGRQFGSALGQSKDREDRHRAIHRAGQRQPVVSTQPIWPKFDGKWMWMDKEGRIQPRVTLFDGLFRQDNPYLPSSTSHTGRWRCGCATRNAITVTCRTTPCRCAGWC